MYGRTLPRCSSDTTVLIGKDSRILRIWRHVKVDGHADEVLAAAQAASSRCGFGGAYSLKINHDEVKSTRKFSRTELLSDRRGSADVVPFRSSYTSIHSNHPHDHGRPLARRPVATGHAAVAAALPAQDGYTLVHAGKQVRFGPVVFWIVIGTVTALGMWSAATATYFAFRDDVLTRLIARQAEMQYAYEDRIAELRAKVDRTTSRQLLDQEQFDQKLEQVMRRQTTLNRAPRRWARCRTCRSPDRSRRRRAEPPQRTRFLRAHPNPPRSAIP